MTRRDLFTGITWLSIAVSACVSVEDGAMVSDMIEEDAMPTLEEILVDGGPADLALCETICEQSRPGAYGGCFGSVMCESYCRDNASTLTPERVVAFAQCAISNPLCYMRMETCVSLRIEDQTLLPYSVTIHGTGFQASDASMPIYGIFGQSAAAQETMMNDGSFSMSFEAELEDGPHVAMFYIDRDEDGSCTPGVDYTDARILFGAAGDYFDTSPREIRPSVSSHDWVCPHFNRP